MRLAIIGQCNNKGIGNMTWEFYNHFKLSKVMIIKNRYTKHLDRFINPYIIETKRPNDNQIRQFIKDLDLLIVIETPYNTDVFKIAREMKVKTVLIPMFEFFNRKWDKPDLYICPSELDYDIVSGNKICLPWPVNDKVLIRRRPIQAKKFIFNTGAGGIRNRNSCDEFYEAIKLVKSDVEFIINRQKHNDFKNYWDLWSDGDVFIFPHKFGGLSLPIQEAMATGLPVITTDFYPFNKIIPPELLMTPDNITEEVISNKVKFYHLNPQTIADKIDEVANWSPEKIGELSDKMYDYASNITWGKMLPKYLDIFKNLINEYE